LLNLDYEGIANKLLFHEESQRDDDLFEVYMSIISIREVSMQEVIAEDDYFQVDPRESMK